GAGFGYGSSSRSGRQRVAVQLAGLSLIGGHPERGVTLEVLDRGEAFLCGEADIGVRNVVLEIDERLGLVRADVPKRLDFRCVFGGSRNGRFRNAATQIPSDPLGRTNAVGERLSE